MKNFELFLKIYFDIPYRRKYYAGVLIRQRGLRWRCIQFFYPKTGVIIEFLLKKWTFGAKKWLCIQICQKWRNNQDWRSICADTVFLVWASDSRRNLKKRIHAISDTLRSRGNRVTRTEKNKQNIEVTRKLKSFYRVNHYKLWVFKWLIGCF